MSIAVSHAGSVVKPASSSLVFKDSAALPLFSVGEEAAVSIMQRVSSRQYLVAVKDRMVLADSAVPLRAGTELRVRVDKQHPQLVLKIISETDSPGNLFTENLRFFRANPQGLLINLARLEELLAGAVLHSRLSPLLQGDIRMLLKSMQMLRYSFNTTGNRNYLKDYPHDLGLLLESDLKKALSPGGERKPLITGSWGGVKGLLLTLAGKVNALLGNETLSDETRLLLTQLQTSVEKSVKTIENQQILNVLLQETQHTHMLQFPLLFPGGMRLGEMFIRSDEHDESRSAGEMSFTVELLLELDELGHLLVEVHMHDRKLDCVCKCGDEAVSEFIAAHLPELQEQLLSAGYTVERLTCVVEQDVEEKKSARHRQYLLYSGESINLFA